MSALIERFLRYAKIDTQSADDQTQIPSTSKQFVLADQLVEELKGMGIDDVIYDREHCYIYATIPSNMPEGNKAPKIGFIAHMDTSPAVTDTNCNPRIVENYDGKDIVLNESLGLVLSPAEYPYMSTCIGKSLIVTDGTTLLGADDKAGVAEIMTMAETLMKHPEIKHGTVKIGFTPDEEVGRGVDAFDVAAFGADFAYTVDGGAEGEIEYENFNAASAKITLNGKSIHPGSAKNAMVNANILANEFVSLLPTDQRPEHTEGYEGFFHLAAMSGNVEKAQLVYIIRDHDRELFEEKKALMAKCVEFMNARYGEGTVEALIKDSYYNMKEMIIPNFHLIDVAKKAMVDNDVVPITTPIRGGTDGCRLSYMGLPCPNLFTGGQNFHGRYEYACVESMEKVVKVILSIIGYYSEMEV